MEDLTRARFPDVRAAAGHDESYYLRAAHPSERLGVWIRYTVHKRPGSLPNGSLWFTLFDAAADGPVASKVTHPPAELGVGDSAWIEIADSRFEPGRAEGEANSERCRASWELEFDHAADALLHLPRGWMYRAPIPRTKTLSPHPAALFHGHVTVDGRTIELDGWPGMVGHNWGAEHAERWIWMHGIGFEGEGEGTWLDLAIGRVKMGPFTTPWIGNGAISMGGERHRLGGAERTRSTEVRETPTGCEFALAGNGISVRGTVGSDARNFVGWIYADPDGPPHNTVNCSISDMRLSVSRDGAKDVTLESSGGATYELGMRETDHGIPLQPFSDG